MITWKIDKLHNWQDNPRAIKKEDFERLKKQITELGQYKPLLVEPDGNVLGGNMRLRAYQELGIQDIWVSVVEPKNDAERVKYALSDNDRVGYYVEDELAELIAKYQDDIDLSQYKVDLKDPIDLKSLLDQYQPTEEDEAPPLPEGEPISKLGEVYQLGRHRLMCGDATKIEDVEKLMDGKTNMIAIIDPPYGINVVGDEGNIGGGTKSAPTTKFRKVLGDEDIQVAQDTFNLLQTLSLKGIVIWGANYFTSFLPNGGRWFVWDKNRPEGLTLSDCELAWSNLEGVLVRKFKCTWDGYHKEGESGTRIHPNQKPIKLLGDLLKEVTESNDLVLDLFGGSGSTLIACEQTNRTCYMMELDPKYCDVIRERYNNYIQNNK